MKISDWIRRLYKATFDVLVYLTSTTEWTYKEINVIIWYFVIPATWVMLLDRIFGTHYFKLTFAAITAAVLSAFDFGQFSNWLFDRSTEFLYSFNALGSNYVSTSVIICVLVPLAIYAVLLWFAFFRSWFSFLSAK